MIYKMTTLRKIISPLHYRHASITRVEDVSFSRGPGDTDKNTLRVIASSDQNLDSEYQINEALEDHNTTLLVGGNTSGNLLGNVVPFKVETDGVLNVMSVLPDVTYVENVSIGSGSSGLLMMAKDAFNETKFLELDLSNRLKVTTETSTSPKIYIQNFLKNNNEINAIGNYSANSTDFTFTATERTFISQLIISLEIDNDSGIDTNEYGAGTSLMNGIDIFYNTGASDIILTEDQSIQQHSHWALYANVQYIGYGGSNMLKIIWSFENSGTLLYLDNTHSIGVRLNDDFSNRDITLHTFLIKGFSEQ